MKTAIPSAVMRLPTAISRALAVMEVNGSMGTVVAAPTAGSCGIIPGCLLTVKDKKNLSDFDVIRALIVAGGIGVTFAHAGVSFSGAVGGCQSEVGVSSALAASALVELVEEIQCKLHMLLLLP